MTTHQSRLNLAYASKIAFKVDFYVTALKFSKETVLAKDFTIDKTIYQYILLLIKTSYNLLI